MTRSKVRQEKLTCEAWAVVPVGGIPRRKIYYFYRDHKWAKLVRESGERVVRVRIEEI